MSSVRYLLAVRGLLERTGDAERQKLLMVADELGIPADAISAVISHESRWNPQAKNPRGSATGLLQWIESTAKGMGTSTAEIARMSTIEQLELAKRYFWPYRARIRTVTDALMAVFMPAYVGKPESHIIARKDSTGAIGKRTEAEVYTANRGFDKEQKGYITVGDVSRNARAIIAAAESLPRVAVPWPPGGAPPSPPVPPIVAPPVGAGASDLGGALLMVAAIGVVALLVRT